MIIATIFALGAAVYGMGQAELSGANPLFGAALFGAIGFVVGRLAAIVLRTASSFLMLAVLLVGLMVVFREQITQLTGIDPVAWLQSVIGETRSGG
ncbi:MAG: hypothetical protein AAF719_11975 [Pseudomonadota bacterium]